MIERRKTKAGRVRYRVKLHMGGRAYKTIGTFNTRQEAKQAEARAMTGPHFDKVLVGGYVDGYLARYRESFKLSSYQQVAQSLAPFRAEFGHRQLHTITDEEAEDFAARKSWAVPAVRTLFNHALRKRTVAHNPFSGLVQRGRGRADKDPLSVDQVDRLAAAAYDAHTNLADPHRARTLRALVLFAAYTGVRQGEAFALEWTDVDFDQMRVRIDRRSYRGVVDTPKSGKRRLIVLPPQARDALLELGRRPEGLVFPTKRGRLITASSLASVYWPQALARYGEKVDFHELRHFAGHYLYVVKDLPARVVAAQLGHSSPRLVEDLYGHFKHGALDDLHRAFTDVASLRVVPESTPGPREAAS